MSLSPTTNVPNPPLVPTLFRFPEASQVKLREAFDVENLDPNTFYGKRVSDSTPDIQVAALNVKKLSENLLEKSQFLQLYSPQNLDLDSHPMTFNTSSLWTSDIVILHDNSFAVKLSPEIARDIEIAQNALNEVQSKDYGPFCRSECTARL